MIGQVEVLIRRLRRALSRSEWMARFLYPPQQGEDGRTPSENGLILIQIDGLSYGQFNRALQKKNLPFLARLKEQENYFSLPQYSGIPSSTPAVQAELFYGVKGSIPAFKFRNAETGRVWIMYSKEGASEMEKRLEKKGEPLLKGGSSYGNIFTGGAEEVHYCAARLGWGGFLKAINPFSVTASLFLNFPVFFRAFFLLALELILAVVDAVRGIFLKRNYWEEIQFILTRVSLCILMRELITMKVKIDLARGLPVIHANFIGYDEQAHRRGPYSGFAHWTLRGIDSAIARIWRAAQLAQRRHYDVWIYSDHGQEEVIPYAVENGRSVEAAVRQIFDETNLASNEGSQKKGKREKYSGGEGSCHRTGFAEIKAEKENQVLVTAMGPVGQIYPPQILSDEDKEKLAQRFVREAKIPLVFTVTGKNTVHAWTEDGKFELPEEAEKFLGEDHPFLKETAQDLLKVCRHPDAGAFTICGWRKGRTALSFPVENGAHGGLGPRETMGFALLPPDVPSILRTQKHTRPLALREAALSFLRGSTRTERMANIPRGEFLSLRIMTYNVHRCIGMDGKLSPVRIARVIARHRPELVALQELDIGRAKTGGLDQVEWIAHQLKMNFYFFPAYSTGDEKFGDAILSAYPMRLVQAKNLPRLSERRYMEPRGALWAEIDLGGIKIQMINTHLSLWRRERLLQIEALLGLDWAAHPACQEFLVLCGDFNAVPGSTVCGRLAKCLRDVQLDLAGHRPLRTWSGRYPLGRIDHIFVTPKIEVTKVEVPRTELEKRASDHLPVIAEIKIPIEEILEKKFPWG